MFRILRDRGELTVKEWAQALDMYRDSFNGNERRLLDRMLNDALVIRESRLIEFERVTEAGWHGDTWQGVKAEWSHRGRYYVYMLHPEAREALEPLPVPKPKPKQPTPRPVTTVSRTYEEAERELIEKYMRPSLPARIAKRVWELLQTP